MRSLRTGNGAEMLDDTDMLNIQMRNADDGAGMKNNSGTTAMGPNTLKNMNYKSLLKVKKSINSRLKT